MEFVETLQGGDIVKHFKGNYYLIDGIAIDSENADDKTKRVVVYTPLYFREGLDYSDIGAPVYTRPLQMFTENVDRSEYNYSGPRFRTVKLRSEKNINNIKMYAYAMYGKKVNEELASKLIGELIESIQNIYKAMDDKKPPASQLFDMAMEVMKK